MAKALILGDPHLGKGLAIGRAGLGSALNSRVIDQITLLNWVHDQCIELMIDTIIVTGDVFEEPKPHPTLIKIFLAWLKKCEASDITVHIIRGNHDILRTGQFTSSALDIFAEAELNNVFIYNTIDTVHLDGVSFTFLPFRDRRSFNLDTHDEAIQAIRQSLVFEAASIPAESKKILVGHLTIAGAIYVGDEIDDASNELFCPKTVFSDYDFVWMGHIHRPQVLSEGTPFLSHVGSMDISDFGETDHIKNLIAVDSDALDTFYTIPIPTRPLSDISISVPMGTRDTTEYVLDFLNTLQANLRNAIVRVSIQLAGPDLRSVDRKVIDADLHDRGVFHICSFSETRKLELIRKKADNISQSMTESAAIKGWSEKFVDDSLRNDFCALAEDIRKELQSEEK
jgi:DNA repair exonuclease SbcCD nuclease subunit